MPISHLPPPPPFLPLNPPFTPPPKQPPGSNFTMFNYLNIAAVLFMWCIIPAFGASAFVHSLVMGAWQGGRRRVVGLAVAVAVACAVAVLFWGTTDGHLWGKDTGGGDAQLGGRQLSYVVARLSTGRGARSPPPM